jgi:hypothetical protein
VQTFLCGVRRMVRGSHPKRHQGTSGYLGGNKKLHQDTTFVTPADRPILIPKVLGRF